MAFDFPDKSGRPFRVSKLVILKTAFRSQTKTPPSRVGFEELDLGQNQTFPLPRGLGNNHLGNYCGKVLSHI